MQNPLTGVHSLSTLKPPRSPSALAQTGFTLSDINCRENEVSPEMFEGEMSEPSFHGVKEDHASTYQLSDALFNGSNYSYYALI